MTPLPASFFDQPFAHRALHGQGRPENSLSAIRAAVARGYGIELDLQLSSDEAVMVFHDETLDRMTSQRGHVADRTGAALARLALRSDQGLGPDTIPTLSMVLDLVDGTVPLLLELKDQTGTLGPDVGALERATAQVLAGYAGPVAVMSFNPHAVGLMAELAPDCPRGLTTCAFTPEDWPHVPEPRRTAHRRQRLRSEVGASFISHDARDLAAAPVAEAKALGLPVACWTIRSPEAQAVALEIADCVTFEGYLP